MPNKDAVANKQLGMLKAAAQLGKANEHLLDGKAGGFGIGAGELSCAGVIYYALNCSLVVAGTYSCAVTFNASGVSWDIGAFTSQVAGAFLVNPKDIAGKCHFTCVVADVGEGIATLTLHSDSGTLYGIFVGDTEGADAADMSGSGTLTVS